MNIPLIRYNESDARKAWEEYLDALEQERLARAKRLAAHQRFTAAFMGGEE